MGESRRPTEGNKGNKEEPSLRCLRLLLFKAKKTSAHKVVELINYIERFPPKLILAAKRGIGQEAFFMGQGTI